MSNNKVDASSDGILTDEQIRINHAHRSNCKTNEEVVEHFGKTADYYDRVVDTVGFTGPEVTVDALELLFKGNLNIRIFDVAAGTGLVGVELVKRGYTNIDAVDASAPMLKLAEEKNVYKKLLCHRVGDTPMPLEDGTYDAVVICAAFAHNFMPVTALDDSIRVVKSGGYVINVYSRGFSGDEWFTTDFNPHVKKLEELQKWKYVSQTKIPNFIDDKTGYCCVHQVL